MGYGLEHDAALLKSLASSGLHNEYRLVDDLEKAGLVYGEVIHQLLYPAVEEVSLLAESCELYNYATNTWASKLDIGNLISEQQKIFHIRSTTPKQALIAISGRTIHQTKQFEVLSGDIAFQTHAMPVKVETGCKCDLTNYLFRQRTQEYLFKTNALLEKQHDLDHKPVDPFTKYNRFYQQQEAPQKNKEDNQYQKIREEKAVLKQQIKDFFKTMLDYIETHKLKENDFYKVLCDDMYIAIKSFDTLHGMMYAAARQTSQGRQQTYSSVPTQEQTEDLIPDYQMQNDEDEEDQMGDLMLCSMAARPVLKRGVSLASTPFRNPNCNTAMISTKDDQDLDLNYTLSQKQTSAYSSLGVLKMMREVSYHPPEPKEDDASELNMP